MKELSIEEKAARYDEAIEIAKSNYDTIVGMDENCTFAKEGIVNTFHHMFPELKESEDEKIKKAVISCCIDHGSKYKYLGVSMEEMCAWIEKQAEQNPTYNVEPKFKQGEWIVWKDKNYKVNHNGCGYELFDQNGLSTSLEYGTVEESARLWTIQDAKDGDVLCGYPKADYPWIGIFCKLNAEGTFNSYCYLQAGQHGKFCPPSGENIFGERNVDKHSSKYIVPATKEQRDLLFQKMKEAGYEWDTDKKELKKIHNALEECEIEHIEHGKYYYCIKDYFAGGKKQASKGDVVQALRGLPIMALGVKANEYFLPVNSIKQNPAWSEKDEKIFRALSNTLARISSNTRTDSTSINYSFFTEINWLKSLKDRYTWKPSDEQMQALAEALSLTKNCGEESAFDLRTLHEQLKKL